MLPLCGNTLGVHPQRAPCAPSDLPSPQLVVGPATPCHSHDRAIRMKANGYSGDVGASPASHGCN